MSGAVVSVLRLSKLTADIDIAAASLVGVVAIWLRVKKWLSDPYRPELHYMRGPGPKWRERHADAGSIRSKSPDIGNAAMVQSAAGHLQESLGIMVNYLCDHDSIEDNHEAFVRDGTIVRSLDVDALMQGPG